MIHDNALGLMIPDSGVAHFISWSNEKLKDLDFSPIYKVDIIADAKDLRPEDILSIADASDLWGQGIDEPLICVHNVPITDGHVHLYGGSTLKFDLCEGISAVKFKASEEEFAKIDPGQGCTTVDIIGTCKRNTGWDNGAELIITDYEVTGKQEWYF